MKNLFTVLILVFTLVAFNSCSDDDDNKDKWTEIAISDYSLGENYEWVIPQSNTLYRIDNEEEYLQYVEVSDMESTTENPAIDFEKYTLLVVQGISNNGIESVTKKLTENGNYKFDITIKQNDTAEAEQWTVAVLAPKLTKEKTLLLNIDCPSCQDS